MKKTIASSTVFKFALAAFFVLVLGGENSKATADVALVFNGAGACEEFCAEAAAKVVEGMGFEVRYVNENTLTPEILKGVRLWVQPGGNAIDTALALGPEKLSLIREFVRDGGSYVGFCAGAFLADDTVDNEETIHGLGIIPISTADLPIDSNEPWGILLWVYETGTAKRHHMYFNTGGTFILKQKEKPVNVLATYGLEGLPAAIQVRFGKGNVVAMGAHPEALDIWKTEADLVDTDGSDVEYARELVRLSLEK